MRVRILVVATAVFAATLAVARPAEARTKLAVLGIEPVDQGSASSQKETAQVAKWLTAGLRERASRAQPKYEIAPNSRKELTEMKLLANCWEENTGCMAKIGVDLKADHLLFGKLERRKGTYALSLKLLDVSRRSFIKQKADTFPAAGATEAKMKSVATEFFSDLTGIPSGGALVVETNVHTGTVFVDGEPKAALTNGTTKIEGLKPGTVAVTVEAPGQQTWEGQANITDGATSRVEAKMVPAAGGGTGLGVEPGGQSRSGYRIATWTTAVITAGGLTAMTITGLKVRSIENEKLDLIKKTHSNMNPDQRIGIAGCPEAEQKQATYPNDADIAAVVDKCNEGKKMALITNGLIAVNVVAGLATLYFAYKGYLQSANSTPAERAAARRRQNETHVELAPQFYPDGAGVGAVIQF